MSQPLLDFDAYFQAPAPRKGHSQHELQAILLHILPGQAIESIQLLSGGYRNYNYLLRYQSQSWVLRVHADPDIALREARLIQKLEAILPVPRIIAYRQTSRHFFLLMEHTAGELASTLSRASHQEEWLALGRCIGSVLGRVHQVHFEASGFLSPALEIESPMDNLGLEWLNYMRSVLEGERATQHLEASLRRDLLHILEQRQPQLEELQPVKRLVHSDFNLKNLLVQRHRDRWQVNAILDWEFAHAGCPWVDLGNFLRFESELPPQLSQGFIQGYQECMGALPSHWRDLAYLLDLAAMCNFLESAPENSKTFHTACKILQNSVARLR